MSWTDVDLAGISITIEPIGLGEHTFQLNPGAKLRENGSLELNATIVDGEYAGRRIYFTYPEPTKYDWAPRVLKRLQVALGADANEGESPLDYFNRVSAELGAAARFMAPVKDGKTSPEFPTPKRELDIFKVRAAA